MMSRGERMGRKNVMFLLQIFNNRFRTALAAVGTLGSWESWDSYRLQRQR